MILSGRTIALVEDDEIMGGSLHQRLQLEGARVIWHKTLHRAVGALRTPAQPIDAVVCDIRLPDGSGEALFNTLCAHGAPPPFLFLTGHGDTEQAVRLLRSGAADYMLKPFDMDAFLERLTQVIATAQAPSEGPWLGVSAAARAVEEEAAQLAERDDPVLIVGEGGTGKRRIAERIHALSERRAAPFRAIDLTRRRDALAAIFGDAGSDGLMAEAGDGVLFVEQIAAAPDALQARLLEAVWADDGPRILMGNTPDIVADRDAGRLRADLYYHVCAFSITVPPLRTRPEDAVWLASRLFAGMNARREDALVGLGSHAEMAIRAHDWPGNGRELRARMARAMALARGTHLVVSDLFEQSGTAESETPIQPLAEARAAAERAHIRHALEATGGNVSDAARLLRVARTTLWEKMHKLGLSG